MGLTTIELELANPANPSLTERVDCLVDSGAIYSVISAEILNKLGIKPHSQETFRLANGEKITRSKGVALFKYQGKTGGADVIFGESGDSSLLGAMTLEALGFALDPIKRELRPLPMILGRSG